MSELDKQIALTKIELLEEVQNTLMSRLRKDDRTVIYSNFLNLVNQIFNDIIKEEKERWGV